MRKQDHAYYDGIVEGRLIEHGFFGIGKSMFVCRTKNSFYVVTHPEEGDSTLEVFLSIPLDQPEKEMEMTDFVDFVRHSDYSFQSLEVKGHIDDIITVVKMAKANFN
ncbi:hypothetical protein [Paenibacillus alkalitolerans]|uniref:hypothetical protein n=1 Tax=Paenibacillus alkalitolerans TaxID=2799335 RepID=UPI0018F70459|nr:hypothetical protein [Paenibacillus alkalitolerans]